MEQRMPWYADVDPDDADLEAHPKARAAVATRLELGPGDALFLPVGWWHALEALDVSITLTFMDFKADNEYGTP